jgi:hypothetical protein
MAEHMTPEPSEIFAEIQSSPASMQGRTKAGYVGKEADWALRFAEGHEERPGYVRVLFRSRQNEVKYVATTVNLADYPWLNSLRYGEPVQVHGLITAVGQMAIELAGVSLLKLTEPRRLG